MKEYFNNIIVFNKIKNEYKSVKMNDEQIDNLENSINQAKIRYEKGKIINMNKGNKVGKKILYWAIGVTAVACCMLVVLPNTSSGIAAAMEKIPGVGNLVSVVTFKNHNYEDDRNNANIEMPVLGVENEDNVKLNKSVDEINKEIEKITEKITNDFKENLMVDSGYQDVMVKSELINTTDNYFTLKLICYQAMGSGYEWDYFYTIDLNTGERMELKDLFVSGADYITPISDNIKAQMEKQMADETAIYWYNDPSMGDDNFNMISDDVNFYINEDNNLVISFDQGDVAPMYMGTVEFVIDNSAIDNIKNF